MIWELWSTAITSSLSQDWTVGRWPRPGLCVWHITSTFWRIIMTNRNPDCKKQFHFGQNFIQTYVFLKFSVVPHRLQGKRREKERDKIQTDMSNSRLVDQNWKLPKNCVFFHRRKNACRVIMGVGQIVSRGDTQGVRGDRPCARYLPPASASSPDMVSQGRWCHISRTFTNYLSQRSWCPKGQGSATCSIWTMCQPEDIVLPRGGSYQRHLLIAANSISSARRRKQRRVVPELHPSFSSSS